MKDILIKIGKILLWVFGGVTLLIAAGTAVTSIESINIPGEINMFVVTSGSMEPVVSSGSIVVTKEKQSYEVGDIVTYKSMSLGSLRNTVTHRIVEIDEDGTYITKGDANEDPDLGSIEKEQVVGEIALSIPWIGDLFAFVKTDLGFILLIVIPAVLIVYHEANNIKEEAVRMLKKKKDDKNE